MENAEIYISTFCDRLRKLRKRLNLNIEDLALRTGLSFNQIQRIEGDARVKNDAVIKSGGQGRVSTLLVLLEYYSRRVSLDALFNFNIPVSEISLDKSVSQSIAREKVISIIQHLGEVAQYMD
jgi:transcriptional regulator with XRE-family HTH domain